MPILFAKISPPISVNSDQFVDIPGLTLDLPEANPFTPAQDQALIILNVPMPYAEGNNFPGVNFGINVDGQLVAFGGFTYSQQQPESFGRQPFTLVVRVDLPGEGCSRVRAQWQSVRGSTGHIDSYASISAILC